MSDPKADHSNFLSVDTVFDRILHRPPAWLLAKLLSHTAITPNQVTVFGLIPAIAAAIFFATGTFSACVTGALFFYLWGVIDHTDGTLARLTQKTSAFGQQLDDVCDNIGSLFILWGIFAGLLNLLPVLRAKIFLIWFAGGLVLNLVSGILVLYQKRKVRREAVDANTVTNELKREQNLLDHFTGREPFYILVGLTLLVTWIGGELGPRILIVTLITALYSLSMGSLLAWFRMLGPVKINPTIFFNYNRLIANRIAPWLAETTITPNQITLLAMTCGVLAAFFMAGGSRVGMLWGAFFLQLSFILDNCDGQVARLKNLSSKFGQWLDYLSDLLVDFCLWVGLAVGSASHGSFVWILAGVACAGSFIKFLRVLVLRRLKPKPTVMEQGSPREQNVLTVLVDDGDPSILVWLLAFIGQPIILLIGGCLYINLLWAGDLISKLRTPTKS